MSIDEVILKIGGSQDNQANLRRLTEQLGSPVGVIPFVGAGLSIPLGFPGWSGFLLSLAERAGIQNQIRERINAGEYEEAAEDLLAALERRAFDDALEEAFGVHKLGSKGLMNQAVSVLPKIATGPVITTNFDHVLEEAFRNAGCPFEREVWGAKADLVTRAFYTNRKFLLKMHGDVEDSTDRILSRAEYQRHYGDVYQSGLDVSRPVSRLLQRMLSSRPVLFVGCSLNQDRVLAILRSVVQSSPDLAHYAIVERPSLDQAFRDRARYLSGHGIRPIWYPEGEHELIKTILGYLGDQIPPHFRPCQPIKEKRELRTDHEGDRKVVGVHRLDVRYQLFFQESGSAGFPKAGEPTSWYFGICGCVFPVDDYRLLFDPRIDELKRKYFGVVDRDEAVILAREEIKGGRGAFACLQNKTIRAAFDEELLGLLGSSEYHIIVVVLDKRAFFARVGQGGNPRACCLAELADRYCAFLTSRHGFGDLVGQARKKYLDRDLMETFVAYWAELQRTVVPAVPLRSRNIKLKPKGANIVGVQMASLLAHPTMQGVLHQRGLIDEVGTFTSQVLDRVKDKYVDGGRLLIRL